MDQSTAAVGLFDTRGAGFTTTFGLLGMNSGSGADI
jgi:hypothetical protein